MTKLFLAVLLIAAVLLAGLGSLGPDAVAASVVTQVPGTTVVQDDPGDLILINADPLNPGKPCSLPPSALGSPPWTDIESATITQLDGGWIEISITVQATINQSPPFPLLIYVWQFEGGCIGTEPGPVSKEGVRVLWNGTQWEANWYEVVSCDPRTVEKGDPVDFSIVDDTVHVYVQLSDLIRTGETEEVILWHAGVRRMPFQHGTYTHTIPVDVAPDVIAWNPAGPPWILNPEPPAEWEWLEPDTDPSAITDHPFNYTITATGTQNISVPSNQEFNWTVTATWQYWYYGGGV